MAKSVIGVDDYKAMSADEQAEIDAWLDERGLDKNEVFQIVFGRRKSFVYRYFTPHVFESDLGLGFKIEVVKS